MKNFVIVYDFDGTLTDVPYPRYGILEKINLDTLAVIQKYSYLTEEINGLVNTFMYGVIKALKDNNITLTSDNIKLGASTLTYTKGVDTYFENINKEAENLSTSLSHFVITSGLKEFLCNTKVAKYFSNIYGSSYYYEDGIAKWANEVIESSDKVNKIYEINSVRKMSKNDCHNMIYIGDGLTDLEPMKFVKENGGFSICVHGSNLSEYEKLKKLDAINESFMRNYSKDSELYNYIKEKIREG